MGQYYVVVNLDSSEYIHSHHLGCGLKLWEIAASHNVTAALTLLLAVGNGRGGGDYRGEDPEGMVGSWAGQRIAIVGDYAEDGDTPNLPHADLVYAACCDEAQWQQTYNDLLTKDPLLADAFGDLGRFTDISAQMRPLIADPAWFGGHWETTDYGTARHVGSIFEDR